MAIESATWISDLDPANPKGTDQKGTADDHARLIKQTIVNSFSNINAEVSASAGALNYMVGVTSSVQGQIDAEISSRAATSATLNLAIDTLSATLNTQITTLSSTLNTQIIDLSATLNAAKLDVDATAAAAIEWNGAEKVVGETTASVSSIMAVGDLGFVIP